jgi:hypothetical protein
VGVRGVRRLGGPLASRGETTSPGRASDGEHVALRVAAVPARDGFPRNVIKGGSHLCAPNFVSDSTTRTHTKSIYRKLDSASRDEVLERVATRA